MFWMILYACVTLVSSTSWTTGTTFPYGCVVNGVHYNPGDTIYEGREGNWCYGEICGDDGETFNWDHFNCGTTTTSPRSTLPPVPTTTPPIIFDTCDDLFEPGTAEHYNCLGITPSTTPPTTTPPYPGCLYNGVTYEPGSEIDKGQVENFCWFVFCGDDGEIIHGDDFNCGTTTTTPTTTTPTTPTISTIGFIPKCVHGGSIYLPGQEITTSNNGTMCSTLMCGENSVTYTVEHCDCFHTNPITVSFCAIEGVCYAAGQADPESDCLTCDPSTSISSFVLSADYCYIGGVCYDDGSPNPHGQCQRCTSATITSVWTTVPAVPIKLGQTLSCNDLCNAYGRSGYKLGMICKYAAVLPASVVFRDFCLVSDYRSIEPLMCNGIGPLLTRIAAFCSHRSTGNLIAATKDPAVKCT